jgi:drug/metabolite transporter (DMT)-like permease
VDRARETAGAAQVTFESGVVTSAVLLVVALLLDTRILPQTWEGTTALAAMAFISHAGGQGLLVIALGRLPPVFSSLVIYLEALAAALFGWLILNEALTPVQSLGGALILVGIWVARPRADAAIR